MSRRNSEPAMSRNSVFLSLTKKNPFPGHFSTERWSDICAPRITDLDVKLYLENNPEVFKQYVMESVSVNDLEDLIQKKRWTVSNRMVRRSTLLSNDYGQKSTKDISKALIDSVNEGDFLGRLEQICKILVQAYDGDRYNLYVPKHNDTELFLYRNGNLMPFGPIDDQSTVSVYTFNEKTTVIVPDLSLELGRFPQGAGPGNPIDVSVMCIPVILPSNDVIAVVEILRNSKAKPFSKTDMQLAHALIGWMIACIHENSLKRVLTTQQHLNDFLLDTTRVIFDEMTSTDLLVQKIMMFTKDLVSADRCSMFLVDEENNELYADYFDEGNRSDDGQPIISKKVQIRFQRDKGIAGYVSRSGQVVNIPEAYEDPRFNPEVDKMTGYKTRSILCMPIISKDTIIGVVQLINSLKGEHFTNADENAFKMFSVYCAMALHYSRLYHLLSRQQNQYKVALEVLQYHIVCKDDEMKQLLSDQEKAAEEVPDDFYHFDFCAYGFAEKLPKLFLKIISDLFGDDTFEREKLCKFTLTVRKNYRNIAYHNWEHGFHVAHSLWCMIRGNPGKFTKFEQMALVIAGICHDVDHRGYNNAYFVKQHLPLASLYSTSVMEQHHYKHTVTILQMEGQDIFSFLTPAEYRDMLEFIRHCILSTDLALYFGNQKSLAKQLQEGTYDISNEDTRKQSIGLMMTGADLCAISKPWYTQGITVNYLYEEFYEQGDEEKNKGIEPMPMMDRDRLHERPKQQVGFIDFICSPLYNTLSQILPGSTPLLDGCNDSRMGWNKLLEEQQSQDTKES